MTEREIFWNWFLGGLAVLLLIDDVAYQFQGTKEALPYIIAALLLPFLFLSVALLAVRIVRAAHGPRFLGFLWGAYVGSMIAPFFLVLSVLSGSRLQ